MKKCFECETTEDLQEHHVVPKSRGGTKTVTLCYECHMKAHGRDSKGMNHSRLVKEALARAKARGVKLGNRTNPKETREKAVKAIKSKADRFAIKLSPILSEECSHSAMARKLNMLGIPTARNGKWFPSTVSSIRKRIKLLQEEK